MIENFTSAQTAGHIRGRALRVLGAEQDEIARKELTMGAGSHDDIIPSEYPKELRKIADGNFSKDDAVRVLRVLTHAAGKNVAPEIQSFLVSVEAVNMNDPVALQKLSADASARFDDIIKNRISDVM